ncbi:MAG TPA: type III pantothenate kinase, partial [Saprospiraceae bacterium]|nr:type III pantothenate kinase [Saprospiraceae bacterium]
MFLTVDIGNTRTKAAVFEPNGQLVMSFTLQGNEIDELKKIISTYPVEHVISSATGNRDWKLSDLNVSGKNIELTHETPLPISLVYATPHTLGRDRIAAACGAHSLF